MAIAHGRHDVWVVRCARRGNIENQTYSQDVGVSSGTLCGGHRNCPNNLLALVLVLVCVW